MNNDILVKVGADVSSYSKEMSKASNTLKDFGKSNAETFDAFKKTGAVVTGAGLTLAGGLGIAVKTAADFESAMSNVSAISGATGKDFDSLRKKAIEMGNATMFSASESADSMANLAQMGWETDQILGGIEHTLNLAAAGGLELADSAMIMANTMNQFSLEAEEAARVADVLAFTAASAGTDVTEMGDAMQYAGANASAAGMSIEDTAAFIGILGDAGITGSKAGTSLNSMLRDLKQNAEDGAIAVGEQTVALYDAEGNMRNMPTVISEIIKATEKMSDEQRDAALSSVFADRALVGFNAIASKGADSVANLAEEIYDSEGAAGDMADVMQDNLNGALTELSSAFEGVQIALGSALIPAIREATEFLTKLADWFNNLDEETKENIAKFAALAAILMLVVGPLLLLVGFIPAIASGFATIGAVLAAIFSPVTLIIAGIIALGAALVYAYNEVEWFRDLVNEAWAWISDTFSEALEFIKDIAMTIFNEVSEFIGEQLAKIMEFWDKYGAEIIDLVVFYFDAIWEYIKFTIEWIKSIFQIIWPIISGVVKIAWNYIKMWVENGIDFVLGVIQTILKILKGDWSGAWESIKDTARNIMNNIKKFFKNIDLLQIGKDIIKGLINGIKSMGSSIKNAVSNLASKLPGWIKKPLGIKSPSRVFMEIGDWLGVGLAEGITDTTGLVEKATQGLTDAAHPSVRSIDMSYATPSGVRSTLSSAVSGTVDVNSRDDMIAGAIDMLGRKLDGLTVEMDRIKVGQLVADPVSKEIQARSNQTSRNRGGRGRL